MTSPIRRTGPTLLLGLSMVLVASALSACGAAKAARDTGAMFDRYGCLARDFKGDAPCPDEQGSGTAPQN